MDIRVNIVDRRQPPSITGTTIVNIGETLDTADGRRHMSLADDQLRQLGGRIMPFGVSYAGEPDIAVVIPPVEGPTPVKSIFEEGPV